jgi:hypothetical protein
MTDHPFAKSYKELGVARIEFDYFKALARPQIERICASTTRFKPLADVYGFYTDDQDADRLQLWFGNRSMFRTNLDGSVAVEGGLTLLYTLGPTGAVAIVLYPASSSLAKTFEDHMYLGVGRYTGYQLYQRLPGDLRALVAYGHVTSLDGDPTWRERLQVWWMRLAQPMQVKGEFAKPAGRQGLIAGVVFFARMAGGAVLAALLRPWGMGIAVLILLYFGWTYVAGLITPK